MAKKDKKANKPQTDKPKADKAKADQPKADTPTTTMQPHIKPGRVIKKKTRQIIAQAMVNESMAKGWYDTAQNPRMPDQEIAVDFLEQLAVVARVIRARADKETLTNEVTQLAALSVSWTQNLTYQTGKRSWS